MIYTLIYKYFIGQEVWIVYNGSVVFGKIASMDGTISSLGDIINYIILNGDTAYKVAESMIFPTIEMALQHIIDNWTE